MAVYNQWGSTVSNPWQFQQVKTAAGQQFDVQPDDDQLWNTFLQWGKEPDANFMDTILKNLYSLPRTYFGSKAAEPTAPNTTMGTDTVEYNPEPDGGGGEEGGGGSEGGGGGTAASAAASQAITPQTLNAVNAQSTSMQPGSPTVPGSPYSKLVGDSIQKLLTRGFTPVSENDPAIQAQFQPTANVLERGARRSREEQAERMAFEGSNVGGAGGALDGVVQQIRESTSLQEGQLMGQLVGQELAARRQDVTNAIGFAQGEDRLRLQAQATQIDAELRRLGLALQEKGIDLQQILGMRGLDIQQELGLGNLGLRGEEISNQASQFDRTADFNEFLQVYLLNEAERRRQAGTA